LQDGMPMLLGLASIALLCAVAMLAGAPAE